MKWRKSRYSNGEISNCVELAKLPKTIGIRDSKNPDAGHLSVDPEVFGNLIDEIRAGRHTL